MCILQSVTSSLLMSRFDVLQCLLYVLICQGHKLCVLPCDRFAIITTTFYLALHTVIVIIWMGLCTSILDILRCYSIISICKWVKCIRLKCVCSFALCDCIVFRLVQNGCRSCSSKHEWCIYALHLLYNIFIYLLASSSRQIVDYRWLKLHIAIVIFCLHTFFM